MNSAATTKQATVGTRQTADGKRWHRLHEGVALAGTVYAATPTVELQALKPGDVLHLDREPANRFDPNAVRVSMQGVHVRSFVKLGFIPRVMARWVAGLLDAGIALQVVFEYEDSTGLYASVWVETRA